MAKQIQWWRGDAGDQPFRSIIVEVMILLVIVLGGAVLFGFLLHLFHIG